MRHEHRPGCTNPEVDHFRDHPCGESVDGHGDICRYCGVPVDGEMCSRCWVSVADLPMAEVKAIFAADGTFDVDTEGRLTHG